ncbi:MAG: TetR/AcrR family transcriptional regulator [Deltaproteobacteria bacterium]|nr:TetR/AcrR family transcriptional regulator [Deltaproteobacteria bacterium]
MLSARPGPSHGERRRRDILATAVDLGSAEGLASLTIGRLAEATGMSKSGLFAHFGSKQGLQLATVDAAQDDFERRVLAPAQDLEPGLDRLRGLMRSWIDYVDGIEFRGGCFFYQTTSEFGSRSGPVHDRLAQLALSWVRSLVVEARVARRQRQLRPEADPEQLVFGLHACVQEANWARELFGDSRAFERARTAVDAAIETAACSPSPATGDHP